MIEESESIALHEMMRKADWFYEYTEDMDVYRSGVAEQQEIIHRLGRVPLCNAAKLIKLLVPLEMQGPFIQRIFKHYGPKGT